MRLAQVITGRNTDSEFKAFPHWKVAVTLSYCTLDCRSAVNGVDHTCELDEHTVTHELDDAAVVGGDGRIDHLRAVRFEPSERPLLVFAHEPRVADDVSAQD